MKFIITAIALILAGVVFFAYTKPTYDALGQTQAQIAQYDIALNKVAELDKVRDGLLAKNNAFDPAQLDRLQKLIPDHVDNISLILDIDGIANKYGIALQNIDVGSAKTADTNSDTSIHSGDNTPHSLVMHFSVQGNYDTLLAFLGDLQSSLRLVDIQSLNLTNNSSGVSSSAGRQYSLLVGLRTYWIE